MMRPINSRYDNWFSGNAKLSWNIKDKNSSENPPMEHFIALTNNNSRFLLINLLKLVSMLHKKAAETISRVPITWPGEKLVICPLVAKKIVPVIMKRNPNISAFTNRSLRKNIPIITTKSISTFISNEALTAVI